jgi:hypothetical protein
VNGAIEIEPRPWRRRSGRKANRDCNFTAQPLAPWFSQMLTCTGPSRNLSAGLLPGVAPLSVDSGRGLCHGDSPLLEKIGLGRVASFELRYKKDEQWQTSHSYGASDLIFLENAAKEARHRIESWLRTTGARQGHTPAA